MTTIKLDITFNQPFRIATGHGRDGVDAVIDRANPFPATSVKGMIREAARLLLPGTGEGDKFRDHSLVAEVFGSSGCQEVLWNFSDPVFQDISVSSYLPRTRVSIDEHRRARPGALYVAEELHVAKATAEITEIGRIKEERKPLHLALLHLAARLVDGIGADKRRGLGWVSISTNESDEQIKKMVESMAGIIKRSES